MPAEHHDVLIIGAGLSGIDAGWHLTKLAPKRKFVILENRERIGGTWDLFRYPGIRSDSDMLTMGYRFRPWTHPSAISPGNAIREYVADTAKDAGIDKHIRFRHKVTRASWDSNTARWTVEAQKRDEQGREETVTLTANFLFSCAGYYKYDAGYTPEFQGRNNFKGTVIHPQHWPENLNYAGKRIIVIGSGATAVTLIPNLAKTAGHVTMLQRSPTYYVSRPEQDKTANFLRRWLPASWAYAIPRWRNIVLQRFFFNIARKKPTQTAERLIKGVADLLPEGYDVKTHFTPKYNPWDQRLCLVPDADFFRAIRAGKVSIVTDHIETFTETGLKLRSGRELAADLIVTATGLVLIPLGGVRLAVDGRAVDPARTFLYKGMMYSDVPNLASVFGYTNASWTLKADLVCEYVCRLLNHMDRHGFRQCTPRNADPTLAAEPWVDFSSGYIQRALAQAPKQGSRRPWKLHQNYLLDLLGLRFGSLRDEAMVFSNPVR